MSACLATEAAVAAALAVAVAECKRLTALQVSVSRARQTVWGAALVCRQAYGLAERL